MSEFRIGGVYRNDVGQAVRLSEFSCFGSYRITGEGRAYANAVNSNGEDSNGAGIVLLSSGKADGALACYGVLPGELHQVSGQWVPITSLPADATEQAEIDAAKCQPAHVSHVEPERKPLDWNKSTPFDSFPGYEVFSDAVSSGFVPAQPKAPLHPLQKMNEGGNALHGSAALLKD
jgi:hypothetical protein